MRVGCLILWAFLFSVGSSFAGGAHSLFYNLKHPKTNVRFGPGESFPVKYVLKRLGMPVEIVRETKEWYLIRDFEGEEGWILKRMVVRKNYVWVAQRSFLKKDKKNSAPILAELSKGVLVVLKNCDQNLCRVEVPQKKIVGWTMKKNLWGANP